MPEDARKSTFAVHEGYEALIPGGKGWQYWHVIVEVIIGDSRVFGVPN